MNRRNFIALLGLAPLAKLLNLLPAGSDNRVQSPCDVDTPWYVVHTKSPWANLSGNLNPSSVVRERTPILCDQCGKPTSFSLEPGAIVYRKGKALCQACSGTNWLEDWDVGNVKTPRNWSNVLKDRPPGPEALLEKIKSLRA